MEEAELYTRIEDYLDNTLDVAGRIAFEADLETDVQLADALEQVQEARSRLHRQWAQENSDRALTDTLKQVGGSHFQEKNAGRSNTPDIRLQWRRWWPAAALAACFAGVLIWFFRSGHEPDLYAQYSHFPPAAFGTRGAGDPETAKLPAADAAFNAGRYAEAKAILQADPTETSNDQEKHFFVALCQLALGQTTEAAAGFQQLLSAPAYADEADWYLALTYLKAKQPAQCADQLRRIPTSSRHFHEAKRLLAELPIGH